MVSFEFELSDHVISLIQNILNCFNFILGPLSKILFLQKLIPF